MDIIILLDKMIKGLIKNKIKKTIERDHSNLKARTLGLLFSICSCNLIEISTLYLITKYEWIPKRIKWGSTTFE